MNSQKKPVSVRIPTEIDYIPKVLDFNSGLFAEVWMGLGESPVMEKQQDLHGLEGSILLSLNKGVDRSVTRPEVNGATHPESSHCGGGERSTASKYPASHFFLCLTFTKLKWKLEARKPRIQSREGKSLLASPGYRREEKKSEQQMESGRHIVLSED